jgi:hypothetical protein
MAQAVEYFSNKHKTSLSTDRKRERKEGRKGERERKEGGRGLRLMNVNNPCN